MNGLNKRSNFLLAWLLVIPVISWFYIGLFLTIVIWYPTGLAIEDWQAHILNFSTVYIFWLAIFFSYRLLDWESFRISKGFATRLISAIFVSLLFAVVYFYFQPDLLITPRRFLVVHLLISGLGIALWFYLIRRSFAKNLKSRVFAHSSITDTAEVQALVDENGFLGIEFAGVMNEEIIIQHNSIVVIPASSELSSDNLRSLFSLRNKGVQFVDFYDLHENLTRTIHLSALSDLWFLHSIDYGTHQLSDFLKRCLDIVLGLVGFVVFLVTFPVAAILIKLSSTGPVFFTQNRVGLNGTPFTLYKYRTMKAGTDNNIWTSAQDSRITPIGKILRALRLDELPQSINIIKGDMSIVGPRPEQVNIVAEMREQIPYYDERHIVKPGLTGWAQLHVYAATVEETKRKLQYDLYYIKHRSLLFDIEIILKTAYNILTFKGR